MDLRISNAILHVLNNEGNESYISKEELDIESETCNEFIKKYIKKLVDNPASKTATFNQDSNIYNTLLRFKSGEIFFKEASTIVSENLSSIMTKHVDIPSADVLLVHFEMKSEVYFAILKLNYKPFYTHVVEQKESGFENQVVHYAAALPFDGGKVEEACLIQLDQMLIRLLEKPYIVDGEPTNYFSKLFLDCAAELSKKEAVQIINDISEEINAKFFNNDVSTLSKVKTAYMDYAADNDGEISIESIANEVFGEEIEIKNEYISLARESGIQENLNLGEKFTRRQFSTHKLKASNGIEVKFPTEFSTDPEIIEFINNPDGSTSIVLKNLRID